MSTLHRLDENTFFRALFAAVVVGITAVIAWSDAFVVVLIRLWLQETFA